MPKLCSTKRLSLLLALSVIGCRDHRGRDCQKFVLTVNGELAMIDGLTSGARAKGKTSAGEMNQLAERYQGLADQVGRLHLRTPDLARLAEEYGAVIKDAAKCASGVADSLEHQDLNRALSAQKEFGQITDREGALVRRINAACAGGS